MEFERVNKVCFEKDLDYLKKTFILQVIKEQMENEQEKFIENILPRIMHDWEISVIDRMDEDDPNIICTEGFKTRRNEGTKESTGRNDGCKCGRITDCIYTKCQSRKKRPYLCKHYVSKDCRNQTFR